MDGTINLPTQDLILHNFQHCLNWEEKYLYIIELGYLLSPIPKKIASKKYLVPGCQSKVWICINTERHNKIIQQYNEEEIVKFYGNSDSAITKGILCIIFVIHQGLNLREIISFNPNRILNDLQLTSNLTYSRTQGITSIVQTIKTQAKNLLT